MAQRQFRSDDTSVWGERYGCGIDGAGSAPANVYTTFTATSGSTSGTAGSGTGFAAGNLILIHQTRNGGSGAGVWEFNKIDSVGGGTNWTLKYATTNAYDTTAQVYLMKQFTSYNGALNVPTAWDGSKGGIAGFFCVGTATITGGSASSSGYRASGGGLGEGQRGEGTAGDRGVAQVAANGNGAGGGDGGGGNVEGAGGGGGGHAAVGTTGQINTVGNKPGGVGGEIKGNAGLTVMVFGGAGGSGAGNGTTTSGAGGGNGGGILIVVAKTINITGAVATSGANGLSAGSDLAGGGGGGAGGSVLLKGQIVNIGSGLITAAAGSGGTANNCRDGGNGAIGRIHIDYSQVLTGTSSPTLDSRQDGVLTDFASMLLLALL